MSVVGLYQRHRGQQAFRDLREDSVETMGRHRDRDRIMLVVLRGEGSADGENPVRMFVDIGGVAQFTHLVDFAHEFRQRPDAAASGAQFAGRQILDCGHCPLAPDRPCRWR